MKKKIFRFIGIIILLFSLTGCIKFNAVMEIKKDKSMDFQIIYAINKSMLEMSDSESELITEEQKKDLLEKGFKISDYEDDNNKGFKLVKHVNNIDEYSSETDVEYSLSGILEENKDSKLFKVIKSDSKNKYIANFSFDTSSEAKEENVDMDSEIIIEDDEIEISEDSGDLSQMTDAMTSTMDLKYTVKLPNKPINHNATSVSEDGLELTWDLAKLTGNIEYQFELTNGNNLSVNFFDLSNTNTIVLIISIIAFVVGLTLLIVSLGFAKKRKKNNVQ